MIGARIFHKLREPADCATEIGKGGMVGSGISVEDGRARARSFHSVSLLVTVAWSAVAVFANCVNPPPPPLTVAPTLVKVTVRSRRGAEELRRTTTCSAYSAKIGECGLIGYGISKEKGVPTVAPVNSTTVV